MVEEAPLCRFRRIEIIGRGDGISPNLVKNLHIVRRVGTLSTAQFKTVELKEEEVFPSGDEKLTYSPPSENTFLNSTRQNKYTTLNLTTKINLTKIKKFT